MQILGFRILELQEGKEGGADLPEHVTFPLTLFIFRSGESSTR